MMEIRLRLMQKQESSQYMYLMLSSSNDVVYGSQSLPSIQRAYWQNIAEQLKVLVKVLSLMNISYQKAIKSLPFISLSRPA